jgi:hypothetical protein
MDRFVGKALRVVRFVWIIGLAIISAFAIPQQAYAKEPCSSLPTPPESLGGMRIETFNKFDDERLGIGLTYASPSERLSIFKFDQGYTGIDDAIAKEMTIRTLKDIRNAAERYGATTVKIHQLGWAAFAETKLIHFFIYVGNLGKVDLEFMGAGHDGNCMIKIRYSHFNDANLAKAKESYAEHVRLLENYILAR